jgi:hypothetical protein
MAIVGFWEGIARDLSGKDQFRLFLQPGAGDSPRRAATLEWILLAVTRAPTNRAWKGRHHAQQLQRAR